jgi:hypothetical protein
VGGARDKTLETLGCDDAGDLLLGPAASKASSYVGGKSAMDGAVVGKGAGSCFTNRRMLIDDDGWSNMCSGMDC